MPTWTKVQRSVQPLASTYHIDTFLTSVSVLAMNSEEGMVADLVAPPLPVSKRSGKIPLYTSADFRRDEMQIREGAMSAARGGYTLSSASYFCEQYSLRKDTDIVEKNETDDPYDWREDTAAYLGAMAALKKEKLFSAAAMATGVWGTDSTPSNLWSDYIDSTPISDIETGLEAIRQATGKRANTAVISADVWSKLKHHPDIVERVVSGGSNDEPSKVTRSGFAALFDLDRVLVMDTSEVTSDEGAAVTNADLAPKDMLLLHTPATQSRRVAAPIVALGYNGLGAAVATREFDEVGNNQATAMEIDVFMDYVVTASDLGYFFSNAIA